MDASTCKLFTVLFCLTWGQFWKRIVRLRNATLTWVGEEIQRKDVEDRDLASRRLRERSSPGTIVFSGYSGQGCQNSTQVAKDGIPAWVLTASSSTAQAGSLSGDLIPRNRREAGEGKGEWGSANLRVCPAGNQSLNLGTHRELWREYLSTTGSHWAQVTSWVVTPLPPSISRFSPVSEWKNWFPQALCMMVAEEPRGKKGEQGGAGSNCSRVGVEASPGWSNKKSWQDEGTQQVRKVNTY